MNELLDKLKAPNDLEARSRAFVADLTIPIEERWELFERAPNKEEACGCNEFPFGMVDSPYDDLYLERHETFDFIERINEWQEDIEANGTFELADKEYNQESLDSLKNWCMTNYTATWEYDW